MNLEQLEKRKSVLESTIHKATEEKDDVEKQIEDIVLKKVKPHLARNRISFPELLNLLNANGEELRAYFRKLKKEGKVNKDEIKDRDTEVNQ